ncbi:Clavaminate synthase-like protein [Dunaliella salina]|nr:Clavaminate synthase-like protein [Dunaliella salina]|eukprot:KAF5840817.1 Clavaminate synthase-like protein [Dunaliella salina]
MTLSDFIAKHVAHKEGREHTHASERGQDAKRRGYLAQHPLFDQVPALAADVQTPEYCALSEDEEGGGLQAVNAWFGPAGTVTPLHTDPYHNLLAQVVGRKYVRLYAPSHTDALYPFQEGLTTNTSQVDLDTPDHERFPLSSKLPHVDCLLEPGQMLFIPKGWWHYVKSLSVSFSVSFWWK